MKPRDLVRADYVRAVAVEYAKHFIGIPYHWGGDDPMAGFDCSGFIVEVLQAVGKLQGRDYTADKLYTIFKPGVVALGYAGCLAFWLDDKGRAIHVMLMVDNGQVIGASGGRVGDDKPRRRHPAECLYKNASVVVSKGYAHHYRSVQGGVLMIAELLKIINDILPMLHPDEQVKVRARIEKMEKERDEKKKKALAAREAGDIPALNLLLSELLDEL